MSPRSIGTSRRPDVPGPRAPRRLIVSFHDLHPGTRAVGTRLLARLADLGIHRTSLLVVPRWHGDPPCTADAAFVAWLRDLAEAGHDLCLHGWSHQAETVRGGPVSRSIGLFYTQGEGEFFQITQAEAARRVHQGLDLLTGSAGLPVFGFTPPAWLLSPAGRDALVTAGLHYNTTWGTVELLREGRVVRAPTLVYSCRNAWRRTVSRAWVRLWHRRHRRAPILRIAIHPMDLADPRVEASLFHHLATAMADGRTAATYRDLLRADATPVTPLEVAIT